MEKPQRHCGSFIIAQVSLRDIRQRGRHGGLAHSAEILIGQGQAYLSGQLRVLIAQDLFAVGDDQVSPLAGHDPAQQQHIAAPVEAVVEGQGMGQVAAYAAVDGGGSEEDEFDYSDFELEDDI